VKENILSDFKDTTYFCKHAGVENTLVFVFLLHEQDFLGKSRWVVVAEPINLNHLKSI
jgi:hypothetical protein